MSTFDESFWKSVILDGLGTYREIGEVCQTVRETKPLKRN